MASLESEGRSGAERAMSGELSMREPILRTQFVLCLLAALEGADNNLLGSSLDATVKDLNFGTGSLAVMASAQGVATNLAAPFWGVFSDRGIASQKTLLIVAALGQGLVTFILAWQTKYGPWMVFWRALNGLFLAGLRPIANGIVAKTTSSHLQGKIFSRVLMFILGGGGIVVFVQTPVAGLDIFKMSMFGTIKGWRVVWAMVGLSSMLVALITAIFLEEPPRPKPDGKGVCQAVREELGLFAGFLTLPSFGMIVIQGIFGTIPWTVLWMMQYYYQAQGVMSKLVVGTLVGVNPFVSMLGTALGGYISDFLELKFGVHGRPLTAQITVALGVPFMWLNFWAIPPFVHGFWVYFAVNTGFGIFGTWAQAGCNWPILSKIVPEESRSRVMAVEGALENSLAAILGPVFLDLIAKQMGFTLSQVNSGGDQGEQATRLLGLALMIVSVTPWMIAYIFYSLLHWTVPADLRRLQTESSATMTKRASSVSYLTNRGFSARHL